VRRIRALHRRLRKQQGEFTPKKRLPILDELVVTILSQHTSDANSSRAFASLKERFPTWENVAHASVRELADAIRSGGLADTKARTIKGVLQEVKEREGWLNLRRLSRLSDEQVNAYLCSLPGVGPKTAACVLLFSMNRAAFPVDTHVHRVTSRLGLVPDKASAEQAHRILASRVPAELRYEFHMQLIRHGRTICRARVPLCSECALFDLCPAGPRYLAAGVAR
jgi:endonuclease-3